MLFLQHFVLSHPRHHKNIRSNTRAQKLPFHLPAVYSPGLCQLISPVVIAFAFVEFCDFCHFFAGQFKVHDIQIVFDVVNVLASGDYDKSHLNMRRKLPCNLLTEFVFAKLAEIYCASLRVAETR